MADKALGKKDVEEYFKSGGEVVPEVDGKDGIEGGEQTAEPAKKSDVIKEPEAKEPKKEEKKEEKKEVKETKTDDDPHAENHRKALSEARREQKELKKRLDEEAKARAELDRKFNEFIKAATAQPEPDKTTQPVDYFEHKYKKLEQELAQERQWRQQQEATRQQQTQYQQFQYAVTQAAAPFINQTPDYGDAYKHVMETKYEELKLAGLPEEHIPAQIATWEAQFAAHNMNSGANPAERLYALAKRLGYQGKPKPKSEAETKLETVQRGQEAAKTLSGGGEAVELSLATLEQMSDEQIRALAKDPKKWLKAAGMV